MTHPACLVFVWIEASWFPKSEAGRFMIIHAYHHIIALTEHRNIKPNQTPPNKARKSTCQNPTQQHLKQNTKHKTSKHHKTNQNHMFVLLDTAEAPLLSLSSKRFGNSWKLLFGKATARSSTAGTQGYLRQMAVLEKWRTTHLDSCWDSDSEDMFLVILQNKLANH